MKCLPRHPYLYKDIKTNRNPIGRAAHHSLVCCLRAFELFNRSSPQHNKKEQVYCHVLESSQYHPSDCYCTKKTSNTDETEDVRTKSKAAGEL